MYINVATNLNGLATAVAHAQAGFLPRESGVTEARGEKQLIKLSMSSIEKRIIKKNTRKCPLNLAIVVIAEFT